MAYNSKSVLGCSLDDRNSPSGCAIEKILKNLREALGTPWIYPRELGEGFH